MSYCRCATRPNLDPVTFQGHPVTFTCKPLSGLLTHLSLVCSEGPSMVLCVHYQFNLTGYWPPENKGRVGIKGGRVAIYVKSTMQMVKWENLEEEHIGSKWITVRPKKLPREIHILIVGAIYHSPKSDNLAEQFAMILHIQTSLEQMLQKHPNVEIIAGDLNKLKTSILASCFHLKQIVNVSTRKKNTLDKILTNLKKYYLDPFTVGKLGNSDHEIVVAVPSVTKSW